MRKKGDIKRLKLIDNALNLIEKDKIE